MEISTDNAANGEIRKPSDVCYWVSFVYQMYGVYACFFVQCADAPLAHSMNFDVRSLHTDTHTVHGILACAQRNGFETRL